MLDMPLLDTRNGRDLTGTLIADIVLQLLSYVAQTEREFIRQRQREGIEAARQNGVHLGRRSMERPDSFEMVRGAWENGELSCRAAAKLLRLYRTPRSEIGANQLIQSKKTISYLSERKMSKKVDVNFCEKLDKSVE